MWRPEYRPLRFEPAAFRDEAIEPMAASPL
jgi:hypothetical protein